jgi:chromate transporter
MTGAPRQTPAPTDAVRETATSTAISSGQALRFWLKLGLISFGGPAGQIAIMHQELVERRRWISEHRFLHALNYCMVLPGPEAQQLATYLGWLMHGVWGGVCAGALFVLPSLVLLIGLSWVYVVWSATPVVAAIFYGVKPAVVAIVLAAAWRIGTRALRTPLLASIAALAFVLSAVGAVPFPVIVLSAAAMGFVAARYWPALVRSAGGSHGVASRSATPAIIDDDTPVPAHARHSTSRLIRHVVAGLALWLLAMILVIELGGADGTLAQMGWFFTKAALLTFGGAYAVLPYVYDAAVETFRWVTPAQMMDGLALGETTPGPLIMVVTFVGFLGGWADPVFGAGSAAASALIAAVAVTFFTFLPSFIFILAGGPLVEATRGEARVAAPLAAVTAAVVGVILNLAVLFARHTFWPGGFPLQTDWLSIALAAVAAVALIRFRVGVAGLVVAMGAAGLVARLTNLA